MKEIHEKRYELSGLDLSKLRKSGYNEYYSWGVLKNKVSRLKLLEMMYESLGLNIRWHPTVSKIRVERKCESIAPEFKSEVGIKELNIIITEDWTNERN